MQLPTARSCKLCAGSFQLFVQGLEDNVWTEVLLPHGDPQDLHGHSEASAILATRWWLAALMTEKFENGPRSRSYQIITGWRKSREAWSAADVRLAWSTY